MFYIYITHHLKSTPSLAFVRFKAKFNEPYMLIYLDSMNTVTVLNSSLSSLEQNLPYHAFIELIDKLKNKNIVDEITLYCDANLSDIGGKIMTPLAQSIRELLIPSKTIYFTATEECLNSTLTWIGELSLSEVEAIATSKLNFSNKFVGKTIVANTKDVSESIEKPEGYSAKMS